MTILRQLPRRRVKIGYLNGFVLQTFRFLSFDRLCNIVYWNLLVGEVKYFAHGHVCICCTRSIRTLSI